jgi:hypothetical protein
MDQPWWVLPVLFLFYFAIFFFFVLLSIVSLKFSMSCDFPGFKRG